MALPRRGSRQITVDGCQYRWRVRRRPTYAQLIGERNLTVAIEPVENDCGALLVELSRTHPAHWAGDSSPVTPAEVRALILQALAAGWRSANRGSPFKISFRSRADMAPDAC